MEIFFFPWCMLQINLSWPWLELFFPILWYKNLANYSKNKKVCTKKKIKISGWKKNHNSWPKAGRKLVWHYLIVKFLHIWADYILNYFKVPTTLVHEESWNFKWMVHSSLFLIIGKESLESKGRKCLVKFIKGKKLKILNKSPYFIKFSKQDYHNVM
jgi:hypothetical protein